MTVMTQRARILIALTAALVLLGGVVAYAVAARPVSPDLAASDRHGTLDLTAADRLLFLTQRRVASVAADDPTGPAIVSDVECVRVYVAAGTGICLRQDTAWAYSIVTLDEQLQETATYPLQGLPNRARVSPSGRMVAWTSFIGGESYNKGGFSTRTGILDTETGAMTKSLESFSAYVDGRRDEDVDHNIWGVTFTTDDNRFYATLSTDGTRYLVEGDLAARTLRTLASNIECPSLSPDGTRIAFKQAIDDDPRNGWRLSVLTLDDLAVTNLAETRSIDDQPAWLTNDTIAYTHRDSSGTPAVWSVPANGSGTPELLRNAAESPAAL